MFVRLVLLNCSRNGAVHYFDSATGPNVGLAYWS